MQHPDLRSPYPVDLWLSPATELTRPELYHLDLFDRTVAGAQAAGVVHLGFTGDVLPTLGLPVDQLLQRFARAEPIERDEALAFGRLLFSRLCEPPEVHRLWEELRLRQGTDRPLRLELALPATPGAVSELPFELLAEPEGGFLFRRAGHTLVRVWRGFAGERTVLGRGDRAGLVWANPVEAPGTAPIPASVFQGHTAALDQVGRRLGLQVQPPLAQATRVGLRQHLADHRPLPLLSLIAHGSPRSGELLLHATGHPDYPQDPGEPCAARDLAQLLRHAGTRLALLWSCHAPGTIRPPVEWPGSCSIPGKGG